MMLILLQLFWKKRFKHAIYISYIKIWHATGQYVFLMLVVLHLRISFASTRANKSGMLLFWLIVWCFSILKLLDYSHKIINVVCLWCNAETINSPNFFQSQSILVKLHLFVPNFHPEGVCVFSWRYFYDVHCFSFHVSVYCCLVLVKFFVYCFSLG